MAAPPLTEDALFAGAVTLSQPAPGHGYRANVDALLVAAFAASRERAARVAVDLGSGVGTIALALAHLGAARSFVLVERQAALAELARQNLRQNGLEARGQVVHGDLGRGLDRVAPDLVHAADLVVANPPYVSEARDGTLVGRPAAPSRRASRQGELSPFVEAAAEALGRRGRACFVYPAHALVELLEHARARGLEPKRLRTVHGRPDRPARVALVELVHGKPGGLVVLPPLFETTLAGERAPEVEELLRARRAEQPVERDRAGGADREVVVPRRRRADDRH